jgi:hypothetical protein
MKLSTSILKQLQAIRQQQIAYVLVNKKSWPLVPVYPQKSSFFQA